MARAGPPGAGLDQPADLARTIMESANALVVLRVLRIRRAARPGRASGARRVRGGGPHRMSTARPPRISSPGSPAGVRHLRLPSALGNSQLRRVGLTGLDAQQFWA